MAAACGGGLRPQTSKVSSLTLLRWPQAAAWRQAFLVALKTFPRYYLLLFDQKPNKKRDGQTTNKRIEGILAVTPPILGGIQDYCFVD